MLLEKHGKFTVSLVPVLTTDRVSTGVIYFIYLTRMNFLTAAGFLSKVSQVQECAENVSERSLVVCILDLL